MSRPVLPRVHLDALRCTFSKTIRCFLRCGQQTGEQYSSIGRTRLENSSELLGPSVRLINPSTLLALFTHLLACKFYDSIEVDRRQDPNTLTSDWTKNHYISIYRFLQTRS